MCIGVTLPYVKKKKNILIFSHLTFLSQRKTAAAAAVAHSINGKHLIKWWIERKIIFIQAEQRCSDGIVVWFWDVRRMIARVRKSTIIQLECGRWHSIYLGAQIRYIYNWIWVDPTMEWISQVNCERFDEKKMYVKSKNGPPRTQNRIEYMPFKWLSLKCLTPRVRLWTGKGHLVCT